MRLFGRIMILNFVAYTIHSIITDLTRTITSTRISSFVPFLALTGIPDAEARSNDEGW